MAKTKVHGEYLDPSVISAQTEVTAVGSDHMLIFDATDNALKKALLSDLIETVGSTPTFTSLTVDDITINGSTISDSGDLTIDTEADLTLTALSDIIHQTTSTNSTAGHHIFKSFNTEIMRIDGGNNLVGIGHNSPSSFSSGANNLVVNDAAGAGGITIVTPNDAKGSIFFADGTGASGQGRIRYNHDGDYMTFGTSGSEDKLVINSAGNVGIGTDSPAAGLHIDNPDNSQITAILDTDNSTVKLVFRNSTETGNNIQIGADGSDLVALTNATERMRIRETGAIEIKGSSTTSQAQGFITNDNSVLTIGSSVSGSVVKDIAFNSPSTMMYIDGSTANVGIGTTSPSSILHLKETGSTSAVNEFVRIENNAGGGTGAGSSITFNHYHAGGGPSGGEKAASITAQNMDSWSAGSPSSYSSGLTFGTIHANTFAERMRIDSSGNLMVGTTESNPTSSAVNVAGQAFSTTGGVRSTVASNPAATFNRKTDEGDVVIFRKDGTTIGTISVVGTNDIAIRSNAANHTGLRLGEGYYIPINKDGGIADNAVDLGLSSIRYKDLYLSGGVNFSANSNASGMTSELLDDYEEGTWTPVMHSSGGAVSASYSYRSGYYIKIGNSVYVRWGFRLSSRSGGSGTAQVTGLPFTSKNYGGYQQPAAFVNAQNLTTDPDGPVLFYLVDSNTKIEGRLMNNADTALPLSYFQTNSWCIGHFTYDVS